MRDQDHLGMNMNGKVVSLDIKAISNGFADELSKDLLTSWEASKGHLLDDLCYALPKLVLLDPANADGNSPDILYCGEEALAAKIMGREWADNAETAAAAFDRDYRELVGRQYTIAHNTQRPAYDLVTTPFKLKTHKIDLVYERLILPVSTKAGANIIACYSFSSNRYIQQFHQESIDEFRVDQRPQNTSHADPFASV
ncbi:hypothetical protein [Roseibium sp. TrichSKD4]|uniref:hypothetical protein n=1 Tax=Roseibium sp. TrichSKD4 TaxID=744980 RepID=UPI0011129B17|nr:hypothetical protein [Roseibium sp. TrichSKD4]